MICRLKASPSSALAPGSRSAGTSRGTLLLPAGDISVASSPAADTSGSSAAPLTDTFTRRVVDLIVTGLRHQEPS